MSFSNIDNQNLGKFLQIAFSEGIRNQISQDYRDWEFIKRVRVGDPNGRELRFLFQKSFGPAAIQYRNPNGSSTFPAAQQVSTSEHSAVYKEIDATVEIEYNLWNRARKSPAKYAEPLAVEIMSKTTAAKRQLAADLYGDGTGVVGQAASADDSALASGKVVVTLSTSDSARGHIGFFHFGDLLLAKSQAGAAVSPTGAPTFAAYRVVSRDRKLDKVTLELIDANGSVLTGASASNIVSTNVFYRIGQPTFLDLTAPIVDFGSATEVIAGLESLVANDGRTIHGIRMEGATAGTVVDAGNTAIDLSHIEEVMNNLKVNVGQGTYAWKMLTMAPEVHSAFVASRETDRRFISVEDNKRGIRFFAYQHGNDTLEAHTGEFVPKKRIYVLPEAKSGSKVLEFHGTDFEAVKMGGMGEFHLKPASSGGHERRVSSYLEALGVLINKHPASCGKIHNFTI